MLPQHSIADLDIAIAYWRQLYLMLQCNPHWVETPGASHASYIPKLRAFAHTIGVRVHISPSQIQPGLYDTATRSISIRRQMSPNARYRALTHELAHALTAGSVGFDPDMIPWLEVLAEFASALTCETSELKTLESAMPYMLHYGIDPLGSGPLARLALNTAMVITRAACGSGAHYASLKTLRDDGVPASAWFSQLRSARSPGAVEVGSPAHTVSALLPLVAKQPCGCRA